MCPLSGVKRGNLAVLAALVAVLVTASLPVIWATLSPHAYFAGDRCACGYQTFTRILGDGYFSYSPGHHVPEHRQYTLRRIGGGERGVGGRWEKLKVGQVEVRGPRSEVSGKR